MVKYGNSIFSLYNLIFGELIKRLQLGGVPQAPGGVCTHAYARVKKFPAVDPSGSFLLSELFGEPSFEVTRRVASPVEGAGRPELVLMFELERGGGAAGCFELDLDVAAPVHEPDVGSARPVREATGLPTFEVEPLVREEELADCVFDFCFGRHNFSPPLLYFRPNTLYNKLRVRAGRRNSFLPHLSSAGFYVSPATDDRPDLDFR